MKRQKTKQWRANWHSIWKTRSFGFRNKCLSCCKSSSSFLHSFWNNWPLWTFCLLCLCNELSLWGQSPLSYSLWTHSYNMLLYTQERASQGIACIAILITQSCTVQCVWKNIWNSFYTLYCLNHMKKFKFTIWFNIEIIIV